MPALKNLGRTHQCVWAAGEVGAGAHAPAGGSRGQQSRNCGVLVQFLFNSVSSADGESDSACPEFANVIVALHPKGCSESLNLQ